MSRRATLIVVRHKQWAVPRHWIKKNLQPLYDVPDKQTMQSYDAFDDEDWPKGLKGLIPAAVAVPDGKAVFWFAYHTNIFG